MFSQVQASKTSFQIEAECIIKRPRFKKFLSSSNFRKHRINTVRRRHLASFILKFYQQFQLRCNTARKLQFVFLILKVSPKFQLPKHRFKQRQNAPFSVLNFKSFAAFQLPKHRFKQRQNAPVSVFNFKGFSAFPTSKTSFQIASECTVYVLDFKMFQLLKKKKSGVYGVGRHPTPEPPLERMSTSDL